MFISNSPTVKAVPKGTRIYFATALILIGALYVLPKALPAHIGTGYIGIFLGLTAISVLVWYREAMPPKSVLNLSLPLVLLLVPLAPYLSNDVQRYMWDGAVFLSGFDPYVTAPNDPLVSHLRGIWPTPEEHAQYPTLYPPGALTLFGVCALAGPVFGLWVWKAMVTAALLCSLILSYKLLEHRQLLRHFPLIGLSPLLLFETQIGGHLDVFSLLGIVAALWCLEKEKLLAAGLIIGLAATIKFLPAVIIGPFLFFLKPKQALKLLIVSAGTWLSIYAVMFGLGYKPLGLLPTFFEKWRGGAPIYPALEAIQTGLGLSAKQFLALILGLAIAGFGVSAGLARKGFIEIALLLTLAVPLLLSPVLFPWYLMALVPFLALKPNLTLFTAITLAPLSYVVLNKWLSVGVWEQADWPAQILLGGLIAAFSFDLFFTRRPIGRIAA